MELNTLTTTLLSLGFLAVVISLVMAFKAILKNRKISKTDLLEDLLQQEYFDHFEFQAFARKNLRDESTFSSLYNKYLKPLVADNTLAETSYRVKRGRNTFTVLVYKKKK